MERFQFDNITDNSFQMNYNIAPSQQVLAVIYDGQKNRAGYVKWGLVPSFAKDQKNSHKMINARAETLHEKPSFNRLLARRRCLVIADSFYEWKTVKGKKTPVRFFLQNNQPFAFAGLWDRWIDQNKELVTCTVITTTPNEVVKGVHDRMPAILSPESEKDWLNPALSNEKQLLQLLTSYPSAEMMSYEVSDFVNSPKNNSPLCMEKV
jgi:putative SOS response-associated peptidase YedK